MCANGSVEESSATEIIKMLRLASTNAALIANNSVQAVKQNDDERRALQYVLALRDNALVIILIFRK